MSARAPAPSALAAFRVTHRADHAGNISFGNPRYSAGRVRAGQLIAAGYDGDSVQLYHDGALIKTWPRRPP